VADNAIEQYPQPDVRGWLVFRGLPDNLRRAEDATLEADSRYVRETGRTKWSRLATETERTLLQFLGYEPPENLHTHVSYITAGIRNRRWSTLEGQTP
jgi:hypothetical protein